MIAALAPLDDNEATISWLSAIERRVAEPQPLLEAFADDAQRLLSAQFESEGIALLGASWAPLAASTLAAKEAAGLDLRILHATLRLRDSLERTTADTVRRITSDSATVGTTVPYAGYHQTGTTRMPQRRIVAVRPQDRRRWRDAVLTWAVSGEVAV